MRNSGPGLLSIRACNAAKQSQQLFSKLATADSNPQPWNVSPYVRYPICGTQRTLHSFQTSRRQIESREQLATLSIIIWQGSSRIIGYQKHNRISHVSIPHFLRRRSNPHCSHLSFVSSSVPGLLCSNGLVLCHLEDREERQ